MRIDWPRRLPQVIANFPFAGMVATAIRKNAQYPEFLEAAKKIYARFRVSGHYRDAIQMYLDLCLTIDAIKIKTLGLNGTTVGSNLLHRILGLLFVEDFRGGIEGLDYVSQLASQIRNSPYEFDRWYSVKLYNLEQSINIRNNSQAFIESLHPSDPKLYKQMSAMISVDDIRTQADELIGRLNELRRYGVKPAYFQDGVMHDHAHAWVFFDPDHFREHGFKFYGSPLAITCLPTIENLKLGLRSEERVFSKVAKATSVSPPDGAGFMWTMDSAGELFYSIEMPLARVSDLFTAAGRDLEYQAFRLIHGIRLFDLVAAATAVHRMPAITRLYNKPSLLKRLLRRGEEQNIVQIPDMIVPRLRYIEDTVRSANELDQELEEASNETRRRLKHEHEVGWFVRPLPEGRHPSPRSCELALEHGITLAENETFVRAHKRGKGLPPMPDMHRAIYRNGTK